MIVASAVRRWADRVLPGDDAAADAAAETAVAALASGASMAEACEAAQKLVRSWSVHPAGRGAAPRRLQEAS